ncbi:hypothetical protein GUJ93_ZPchr0458g22587 [Zizania palustris]|uniref:Uncharacterized protein n=1 Tax=Zizania palustris TaxID=103762 RepID=A0A8J5UUU4_ZIZPA|nr:hypothetical protein GUJ93_ZPchr0458g22587 [Zizania palustris]
MTKRSCHEVGAVETREEQDAAHGLARATTVATREVVVTLLDASCMKPSSHGGGDNHFGEELEEVSSAS